MPNDLITTPFHLIQADGNITEADGVASTWSDIWKYQVPRGTAIILGPGDTFSAYIEDTTTQVGDRDCRVKIEVRDPAESDTMLVYGPASYVASKEFQDSDLIARLKLLEPVQVDARYWIVISVYDGVIIDASDSQFDLYCHRARLTHANA